VFHAHLNVVRLGAMRERRRKKRSAMEAAEGTS
jgi:hypothetical protein